ncbi:MAG: tetratricopeptide repeat protein [Thermodesulfobacteriota bacterium]
MNKSFWPAGIVLLLVAAVAITFFPVTKHDFLFWDDMKFIVDNPGIQAGLSMAGIKAAFTDCFTFQWIPVTWISFLVDHALYGRHPGGYHLTNLIVHAANSALLFMLLRLITGGLFSSALAAFLFAVHPLHVESVAWVTERKDVLSTLFGLLSLLYYARYADSRRRSSYFAALLFFAFSLLSKPMLVTLPCVFLLLDWWPLKRFSGKPLAGGYPAGRLVLEKLPFFALTALASVITVFTMPKVTLAAVPFLMRLENAIYAYAAYIIKTVWPSHLAALYPHSPVGTGQFIGALALVTFVSAVVVMGRTRRPYLAVGWLWYLGTLVPVIGLVQNGYQAMSDHFTYVPLIGLFIMFSWGLPDLLSAFPRRRVVLAAVSVLIVAACMAVSARQVRFWENTVTLFERTLAVTGDNWFAHFIMATALIEEGKSEEAAVHIRESFRICPQCIEPLCAMAELSAGEGKIDEVIGYYQEALRAGGDIAIVHNNLGRALATVGRTGEAIEHLERAAALEPGATVIHRNLAELYVRMGRPDQAVPHFKAVLDQEPRFVAAMLGLGNALFSTGAKDEAMAQYRRALAIKPDFWEAHKNLGLLLARDGKIKEAVYHLEEAVRINPDDQGARATLASLMGAGGRNGAP